jgi:diguanylate cyclase (GGDEF)-like protein
MGIAAATTLVVAAATVERRAAEQQLREWSITDPLTGLVNVRKLHIVLERELSRSDRTGRPFALLMLDVDDLKKINDREGHLVGSRALVRIGEVLKRSSRSIDTAARFGGDEFAVVLPETDEAEAALIADRIKKGIAADAESPPISASVGCAIFPRDGPTIEDLIGAADRAMYQVKRLRTNEWSATDHA